MHHQRLNLTALVLAIFLSAFCSDTAAQQLFENPVETGTLQNNQLIETSGMAPSRIKKHCFWMHNDSGDEARIFLTNRDGSSKGQVRFNAKVKDCEDIATGIGYQTGNYIYLGDIGDNHAVRSSVTIYVFEEKQLLKAIDDDKNKLKKFTSITLQYEDGPRDAECLMLDPIDSMLYIVTKREPAVQIYGVSLHDVFTRSSLVLHKLGTTAHTYITAGDISATGNEVLIKNYDSIFYWKRLPGEHIPETLQRAAVSLPYKKEKQGEAICFAADASGFYTTSEGSQQPVYFYQKLAWNATKGLHTPQ